MDLFIFRVQVAAAVVAVVKTMVPPVALEMPVDTTQ